MNLPFGWRTWTAFCPKGVKVAQFSQPGLPTPQEQPEFLSLRSCPQSAETSPNGQIFDCPYEWILSSLIDSAFSL